MPVNSIEALRHSDRPRLIGAVLNLAPRTRRFKSILQSLPTKMFATLHLIPRCYKSVRHQQMPTCVFIERYSCQLGRRPTLTVFMFFTHYLQRSKMGCGGPVRPLQQYMNYSLLEADILRTGLSAPTEHPPSPEKNMDVLDLLYRALPIWRVYSCAL